MGEFGRSILTRPPEPVERGKVYEYDQRPGDLVIAMQEMTDRRGQAETPPLRAFDEIVKPGALSRGAEGQGDHPEAEGGRHYAVFAAVSRQPQPQRAGGHVYGGAGAVPQPDHPAGGDLLPTAPLPAGRTARNKTWKQWK